MRYIAWILSFGAILSALTSTAVAVVMSDRVSVNGVLAAAVQCPSLSGGTGVDTACGAALLFQPEISFRPTVKDELFIKPGLAAGNGLNRTTPFQIAPWAVDMADDLTDINGSGRNYLLTAWYRHNFTLAQDNTIAAVIGIIDATEYLDNNVYANDPYTQFMNAAMTNGPNTFVPSYDLGAALEWNIDNWSIHSVVMDVSQNIDDNEYIFYGLQLGYRLETELGEGNYRLLLDGTSNDFLDVSGTSNTQHLFVVVSIDQEMGDTVGVFLRLGWQDESPMINYHAIYSGGLDIKGMAWGRGEDNIGLGFARLEGGNQNIQRTQIAEGYYRLVFNNFFSLSADVQYIQDTLKLGDGASSLIYGIRATVEF